MSLKKISIDNTEIEVPGSLALIQACEEAGVEIPRFCYHERLSVAGNCRMCLVEVKGAPKPMASCAVTVNDLRPGPNGEPPVVLTNSPIVKKAREGVMEFLLANHPLDCPICDQGGECDLQDQAMAYGCDSSRYDFGKRAVKDKELGPLVKTVMTRCIHCTRCVRFSTEVAGSPELGAIYRGEETEITPYLENIVTSELSANIIDLCPVGALTSKPYAFTARPWEMRRIDSYDITDAMGSAISLQVRGNEVMRITPRNDDDVNEEWISNKARFLVDGLKRQRLDKPYIRTAEGKLQSVSWDEALEKTASVITEAGRNTYFVSGRQTDIETLYSAKLLANSLGASSEGRFNDNLPVNPYWSNFNASFARVDTSDAILIIGSNPRFEAPVLNSRIRKAWLHNDAQIAVIGEASDLTYKYEHLGEGVDALNKLISGNEFGKILSQSTNPLIIIGEGALLSEGSAIFAMVDKLKQAYNLGDSSVNFLTTSIALQGALKTGFVNEKGLSGLYDDSSSVVVLLGNDDIDFNKLQNCKKIYIGSHGDKAAHHADIILPAPAYTEKNATFITAEGRVRQLSRAVFPLGEAKEDWAILRALSERLGATLPFNNFSELRNSLYGVYSELSDSDICLSFDYSKIDIDKTGEASLYKSHITEFYFTDPICRASKTLAECQRSFYSKEHNCQKEVAA